MLYCIVLVLVLVLVIVMGSMYSFITLWNINIDDPFSTEAHSKWLSTVLNKAEKVRLNKE